MVPLLYVLICQKILRCVCDYFVTRISVAVDWLMLAPMLPRLGGLDQLSLGRGGSRCDHQCVVKGCLYSPMDTEGLVEQAMAWWLVGRLVGWLVGWLVGKKMNLSWGWGPGCCGRCSWLGQEMGSVMAEAARCNGGQTVRGREVL